MKHNNSWYAKSVSLDRYRWMQLRERHGLGGSLLRFCRDAVVDIWLGILAKARLRSITETSPCDILLLQSAPFVIGLKRKKLLIEAIAHRGYQLTETALDKPQIICQKRLLAPPPQAVPLRYFFYAAHATWLVAHHQPKILLNDRNGSLYSPFLRLCLNEKNSLLVQLAHASTLESSRRLGMNDYDYYILFGRSSFEALMNRRLRFGSTTALITGSHMIDTAFDIPPPKFDCKTILVLGIGPDKEKETGYLNTYNIIYNATKYLSGYKILIKRHPRSSIPFWENASKTSDNIILLAPDHSLAKALSRSSIVVNIMSNAVIEATLAGRPIIYCNTSDNIDIFEQERFFGPAANTLEKFNSRLIEIENNYAKEIDNAKKFSQYHLAHGTDGLKKNMEVIDCLLTGSVLPNEIEQHSLYSTIK